MGLARAAIDYRWERPSFVNEPGVLQIKNGRHPLVESCIREPFVPNDTYISDAEGKIHIITGSQKGAIHTYVKILHIVSSQRDIQGMHFLPVTSTSSKVNLAAKLQWQIGLPRPAWHHCVSRTYWLLRSGRQRHYWPC